jgi:hypothetical protein
MVEVLWRQSQITLIEYYHLMNNGSPFNTLHLYRHGEGFQVLDVVHFPWHEVFETPVGDHGDLQVAISSSNSMFMTELER